MTSYRDRMRACPACGVPMDEVGIASDPRDASARAQADRCSRCGGIFLEFFDGEPAAISRGLSARRDLDVRPSRGNAGELACPDCQAPMVRRAYLGEGPQLARCETCMAVFLTPEEVEELARLELAPDEPREEPSWLARLLRWLPGL